MHGQSPVGPWTAATQHTRLCWRLNRLEAKKGRERRPCRCCLSQVLQIQELCRLLLTVRWEGRMCEELFHALWCRRSAAQHDSGKAVCSMCRRLQQVHLTLDPLQQSSKLLRGLHSDKTRPACVVQVGMAVGSVGLSAAILLSSLQTAHAVTPEQLLFLEVSCCHPCDNWSICHRLSKPDGLRLPVYQHKTRLLLAIPTVLPVNSYKVVNIGCAVRRHGGQ